MDAETKTPDAETTTPTISNEKEVARILYKGFVSYLSLRAVGIGLGYVAQIFLSRWLGSHSYGYYSLLATAAFVLAYVVGLGYPTAMQRFLPNYRAHGDWPSFMGFVKYAVRRMTTASMALGVLVGAGLAIMHEFQKPQNPWTEPETFAALLTLVLIPVQGTQEVYEAGLTAQQRWLDSFVPSMLLTPLLFVGGVALADAFFPGRLAVYQVLLVLLLVNILSTGIQRILLQRSLPPEGRHCSISFADKDQWDATGKPVLVMTMFGILSARADLFAVGLLDGHSDAGIYAAVLATSELLNTFSKAANTVVTPQIGPLLAAKNSQLLQQVLVRSAQLATYPTLILTIMLCYMGTDVLGLFGPNYEGGYWALVILCWNQVLIASAGPPAYVLIVSGHSVKVARGFAFSLTVQLVLLAVLTPHYGMVGASSSSLLAGLLLRILLTRYVAKVTGINFGILGGLTHKWLRG